MITLGSVLALAAAALHVVIFALESLLWGTPRSAAVFGEQSPEEVAATKLMAFNQGFYNLFLAVLAGLGAVLLLAGTTTVGAALALAGTGSMLAAALVLLLASPAHRAAAIKQGTLPVLATLALTAGMIL